MKTRTRLGASWGVVLAVVLALPLMAAEIG